MIRVCRNEDLDEVLDVWLSASIQAHDFIEAAFWRSQIEAMRNVYLPMSETYVFERNTKVVGFYALHEDRLAALFVAPHWQGQGIGKQLLAHAKQRRTALTLSVYTANNAGYQFYLSQGFAVISVQADEHTGHPEYTMRWAAA